MTVEELNLLWSRLGQISINADDEIEEDFYFWEKGTDRFEIWHWFDEKLPNGLIADFKLIRKEN